MLDNRILNMTPGEALLDVPMAEIIQRMATAIADAQRHLDTQSISTAVQLGETKVELLDDTGAVQSRSLLELGFAPTFYHFSETTINVTVELSMKVEEGFKVGADLTFGSSSGGSTGSTGTNRSNLPSGPSGPTGPADPPGTAPTTIGGQPIAPLGQQILSQASSAQRASMFGMTISAEYHRKYEFDTSAASSVTTKMLAVPPPAVFMDALRKHFGL